MATPIFATFDSTDTSEAEVSEYTLIKAIYGQGQTDTSEIVVEEVPIVKALRGKYRYADRSEAELTPAFIRAGRAVIDSDSSTISATIAHGRAGAVNVQTDTSEINISLLVRRWPTLPPTGSIAVTTATGSKSLNLETLIIGKTQLLSFRVAGERLGGLEYEFKATPQNNRFLDPIVKSTVPSIGGIEASTPAPINLPAGAGYEVIGTIDIYHSDSMELDHPTLYFYEFVASGSVGERVLIEAGKFLFTPSIQ